MGFSVFVQLTWEKYLEYFSHLVQVLNSNISGPAPSVCPNSTDPFFFLELRIASVYRWMSLWLNLSPCWSISINNVTRHVSCIPVSFWRPVKYCFCVFPVLLTFLWSVLWSTPYNSAIFHRLCHVPSGLVCSALYTSAAWESFFSWLASLLWLFLTVEGAYFTIAQLLQWDVTKREVPRHSKKVFH